MSKPAGSMIRSCLGKARRLTFPGLKPWAVFRSSFGRLEYAQENVQTAERYGAVTVELNLIDPISRADRVDQYRLHRRHEAGTGLESPGERPVVARLHHHLWRTK